MNKEELNAALANATPDEKRRIMVFVEELKRRELRERAQNDFMAFVEYIWPDFVNGNHHKRMARLFESVAAGERKRVIINLAPRHTKSELSSYLLPAWLLGKYPKKKIMQVSNTSELAEGFGRKVRNLVGSEEYREIFPDVDLRQDSKAAGRWNTNHGGEYFATGVGGALAGRGADIAIIDDPHTEAEAIAAQTNPAVYDKVYEWYTSGPRQRLQPGGAIIVVMCMTGDTPVLLPDGQEKPLRDVRSGDKVATFDNGKLSTAKVLNHQSNGVDSIYKIQTQSGKIVRANERHPFLVMNNGVLEWTRLKYLQLGDELVVTKDVTDHLEPKQNPGYVAPARQKSPTINETQMHPEEKWGFMVSGKTNNVLKMCVQILQKLKDYVTTITIKNEENRVYIRDQKKKIEKQELNIDTELLSTTIKNYLSCKRVSAPCVNNYPEIMSEHIGEENYVSTIATIQEKSEAYYAMTAILQLDTVKRQIYSNELRRTSDFTTDPIVSITYDGEEEVFDVEIERTENFIANGVVSHNTRWHMRDLTGQIIKASMRSDNMDQWDLIEFPAILPSGNPLWPEYWSLEELQAVKDEIPNAKWQAQYQQQPTSEEGALIKREWWQTWEKQDPPSNIEYVLMSWDTAFEKHNNADFSAMTVWGVFYKDNADDGTRQTNIILLDAVKKRVEFPELKQWAIEAYREWSPDGVIIEKRASGAPLIYELRRMGIPVQEYTPTKGNDKISRLNSIADIFASGFVWAPDTRWAEEVIDEVASFPSGEHDDLVDTVSQALMRFRQGGFVKTLSDEEYETQPLRKRRPYY